jgi:hypothetical protein
MLSKHKHGELFLYVESHILSLSVTFFTLYKETQFTISIQPIPKNVTFFELVSSKIYDFIYALDGKEIYDLFAFSDYIDFVQLRNVLGMKIAYDIRQCKTVEDIRNHFGFENDFDPIEFVSLVSESNCLHKELQSNDRLFRT